MTITYSCVLSLSIYTSYYLEEDKLSHVDDGLMKKLTPPQRDHGNPCEEALLPVRRKGMVPAHALQHPSQVGNKEVERF